MREMNSWGCLVHTTEANHTQATVYVCAYTVQVVTGGQVGEQVVEAGGCDRGTGEWGQVGGQVG